MGWEVLMIKILNWKHLNLITKFIYAKQRNTEVHIWEDPRMRKMERVDNIQLHVGGIATENKRNGGSDRP
jgi:hypothetical protein